MNQFINSLSRADVKSSLMYQTIEVTPDADVIKTIREKCIESISRRFLDIHPYFKVIISPKVNKLIHNHSGSNLLFVYQVYHKQMAGSRKIVPVVAITQAGFYDNPLYFNHTVGMDMDMDTALSPLGVMNSIQYNIQDETEYLHRLYKIIHERLREGMKSIKYHNALVTDVVYHANNTLGINCLIIFYDNIAYPTILFDKKSDGVYKVPLNVILSALQIGNIPYE